MKIIGVLCDLCGEVYGAVAWPAICVRCGCINPVTTGASSGS